MCKDDLRSLKGGGKWLANGQDVRKMKNTRCVCGTLDIYNE